MHWSDLNNKDKSSLARRELNGLNICFVQVACGLSYFKHHFPSLHNTWAICYTLGAFQTCVLSSALTLLCFEGISHNLTPLKWQNVHKSSLSAAAHQQAPPHTSACSRARVPFMLPSGIIYPGKQHHKGATSLLTGNSTAPSEAPLTSAFQTSITTCLDGLTEE